MAESTDEFREVSEGVTLQVGDSIVAYTYPLTEGLIIDRKTSEDGRLALTLLIAPHKKRGKKWSKAKVSLRDAARLSKKPPGKFTFPIRGVEKLKEEAKMYRADPVWVAAIKSALDKEFRHNDLSSSNSDQENKDEGEDSEDGEKTEEQKLKSMGDNSAVQKFMEFEKRMGEVLQLRTGKAAKKKKIRNKDSGDSEFEMWKKWQKKKKQRKRRCKNNRANLSSSSSSSPSSSSSSEDENDNKEVGRKGGSGIFTCPFYKTDARGIQDVKGYVHGQEATRKHVRVALHNLYAAHYTLVSFADKVVSKANASPFRPFTMDVAWFQSYAENLDELLLNSLQGPWALWNEPAIDQLTIGFLDLLIRVLPHKNYPVCLHDSVRKWMKKQRIGTNAKFGPVSYAMHHAKFTEAGVVLQQSSGQKTKERFQNNQNQKQTPTGNMGNSNTNNRLNTAPPTGGEKRSPPPS